MNIAVGDIEKIMNIEKGDIAKVMGVEIPAGTPLWQGTRGISMGRDNVSNYSQQMLYRTISTSGSNAVDFGDLDAAEDGGYGSTGRARGPGTASSNNVYAVYWTGYETAASAFANQAEVITIATGADAIFGDDNHGFQAGTITRVQGAGICNGNQGHIAGGFRTGGYIATSYKITVGTSGSATSSGDITSARSGPQGISHATYGYYCGGYEATGAVLNKIEKITINSDSNAVDQGDLTIGVAWGSASEDSSRGIMYSGYGDGGGKVDIGYFATASGGDASDFGDKLLTHLYSGGVGNGIICEFWGGDDNAAGTDGWCHEIFYVTVQSLSDAQDTGAIVSWDTQSPAGTGGRYTTLASGVQ